MGGISHSLEDGEIDTIQLVRRAPNTADGLTKQLQVAHNVIKHVETTRIVNIPKRGIYELESGKWK